MGFVKAGGWIAIGLSLALVAHVILINNPEAIIVIAPALVGGIAVVSWPRRRWVLIAALVLVGATATYSLIAAHRREAARRLPPSPVPTSTGGRH